MGMKKYKLGDIAKIYNGSTPSTSDNSNYDGEIVWATPKDLSDQNSKYFSQGARNITQMGFDSCSTQMIPANNILMSSRAPIGLFAINTVACCTNQGFKNIVLDKSISDVDYLYYYLKYHVKEIEALGSGTTFKEVSKTAFEKYEISIPSLSVQQKIAAVLSSLDDKIALNKKINAKLEAMAKRLYDYWFVQFDFPNEEGKPYKSSGGKMEYNATLKRDIPAGWEVGNLYEIADYINGLACQNYRPQDEEIFLPVIKIKEMHEGITSDTEKVSATIPEKYIIFDGDILFSWSATLEVMIWTGGKGGLNQHIFKVVPKSYFTKEYVFQQLSSYIVNFQKMAEARKTTMGHITSDHINQSRIVIPPKEVINAFSEKTLPIFNYQLTIQKEIQKLTKLRDRLLPLLMNGQVEVEG